MALVPVSYKISFYDPSKPGGVISVQEYNANLATSLATQFSMQDIIDTVGASTGTVDGIGTTGALTKWTDSPGSVIGDSPVTIVDGGPGLQEMILGEGYRMVVNRPTAVTAGDPEFQVQQGGVNKISMGWDDDGGGFGFLYNWAGDGWRIGANGANPVLEIITTVGSVGAEVTGDLFVTGAFKDSAGAVGVAGDRLSSTVVGTAWTSDPPVKTRYLLTGMVNNMASGGGGGTDFMEWTSNVAPSTQIPLFRAPIPLKLVRLSYVWMGDAALSIGVGEAVAFTIGTVADNTDPAIGNYVSAGAIFTIDDTDSGTWAFDDIPLTITFGTGDNIGVVGTESGTVTPNDGELSISMVFEEV